MTVSLQPGKLVTLRGRDWIVLPSDDPELLVVKPLGGSDDEIAGIYRPLDLGIKTGAWTVTGTATGLGGGKPGGEGSITGTNIFGLKGLDANAKIKFTAGNLSSASGGVTYGADTKHGRAFIKFNAETVGGGEKKDGPPIGAQGVIGLGFTFK